MTSASSASRPVLVLATGNPGKARELVALLAGVPFEIRTLADYPPFTMPEETGDTYEANARIKAEAAARHTGVLSLGDDSGIEVDALGGAPGIHSARWAGPDKDFRAAMNEVQTRLMKVGAKAPERRRAHFVSALCVAWPDGHLEEFEARVNGTLVWPPRGDRGFGYDPMFLPDGYTQTFGEMSADDKHGLAVALNATGWYHAQLGEHEQAITYCEQALHLLQAEGDRLSTAATWDSIGHAQHRLGRHEQALASYRRAISLFTETGDRYNAADVTVHLGDLYADSGDPTLARETWLAALSTLEEIGHAQAASVRERIERVSREGELVLSYPQERLWFLEQLHPGSAAFNLPVGTRLWGRFEIASFRRALGEVVERHETLRTRFAEQVALDRLSDTVWLALPRDRLRVIWDVQRPDGATATAVRLEALVGAGQYRQPELQFEAVDTRTGRRLEVLRDFSPEPVLILPSSALSRILDVQITVREAGQGDVRERVTVPGRRMLER